ncbi:hypothetical protein EYF80_033753 [Liparis tanakae]|uniref:Uncharacterized protein n=1 Tax=Liparis tanakae TaxID=230148 RepID=A0A4Z2GR44_9TELE|nr:hypothetical protein EYF80_033753 [Liparis tanakae]
MAATNGPNVIRCEDAAMSPFIGNPRAADSWTREPSINTGRDGNAPGPWITDGVQLLVCNSAVDIEPTRRGGERPEEPLQEAGGAAGEGPRSRWRRPEEPLEKAGSKERDGVASEEANVELLQCWFPKVV